MPRLQSKDHVMTAPPIETAEKVDVNSRPGHDPSHEPRRVDPAAFSSAIACSTPGHETREAVYQTAVPSTLPDAQPGDTMPAFSCEQCAPKNYHEGKGESATD